MSSKRISAILTALSLLLFASLSSAPNVQAAAYSFTTLDVPGAFHTYPASINASGQVAGYYEDSLGDHGFVYSNGTFTTFDVPDSLRTRPTSINDSGQVTGYYQNDLSTHGFVYSNGTFTILDVVGTGPTWASSINASGQVTGYYFDRSGKHGFLYSNHTFTTFDAPGDGVIGIYPASISASGQVTGSYPDRSGYHGFVYSNGTFTILNVPGAANTSATSINASGQVTGYYSDGSGNYGFVYSNGTFTTLDVPGSNCFTTPISINVNGQVTGSYCVSRAASGPEDQHGFVYGDGTFTTLDVPGAAATWATSINASGQVTGSYTFSRQSGFIATPVCTTPTVTVHTLTTAPQGGIKLTGSITHEGTPLCALVLANGQSMFTCGDSLPKGDFDLTVPVDDQGQITLFGFSAGLAPFQQTLGPGALPASVNATSCATPKVTYTTAAAPEGQFRLTGSITLDNTPLCALVLANGQFLFTCGDPLGKGSFDLTVPPDDQGKITLFGFVAGLLPFQQTFSPSSTPP
ncbi:MAG: hypothetical protein P9F19_17535 [Candidatus Contendobacter sp.]|nr:hypothetical protein [Candidatus Contendobacter sp.]MDG4559171.1 hypothetical protein [Candidatus Contendobacter sp.]